MTLLSGSPSALLEELYAAALSQNLTNPKALERMRLNVDEGRTSAEQQVDTWSKAISKALDRAQKQFGEVPALLSALILEHGVPPARSGPADGLCAG